MSELWTRTSRLQNKVTLSQLLEIENKQYKEAGNSQVSEIDNVLKMHFVFCIN